MERVPYDNPALLTREETAAYLRISPSTVTALLAAGLIPHVQIGRRRLVARATLEATVRDGVRFPSTRKARKGEASMRSP